MFEEILAQLSQEILTLSKQYVKDIHEHSKFLTLTENKLNIDLDDLPDIDISVEKNILITPSSKTEINHNTNIKPNINIETNNSISISTDSKQTYISKSSGKYIKASVGNKGVNNLDDMSIVQKLLNKKGFNIDECNEDIHKLTDKIYEYQQNAMKSKKADGRVDVSGDTIFHLLYDRKPSIEEKSAFKVNIYEDAILRAASQYNINPNLMKAIAFCESNGNASLGLMQVTKDSWIKYQNEHPHLAQYDYSTYNSNADINILFAATILNSINNFVIKKLNIPKNHPQFQVVYTSCYNAGVGTVKNAIERAINAGSKQPYIDFLKEEFLRPAIRTQIFKNNNPTEEKLDFHYKVHSAYAEKVNKALNNIDNMQSQLSNTILDKDMPNHTPNNIINNTIKNNNTIPPKQTTQTVELDIAQLQAAMKNSNPFISQPVGINQTNLPNDVLVIKYLLYKRGYLKTNIDFNQLKSMMDQSIILDQQTIQDIERFQREVVNQKVDGIVHPRGNTFNALVNGRVIPEKPIDMQPKKVFVGDSIAKGFYTVNGGDNISKVGANPKEVLHFLVDAIKNYDLKNKVLYLSTGYSNNIDDSQKNFIQKQFALIKQYGIKAKVFGV